MTTSKQQRETRDVFRKAAEDWHAAAQDASEERLNTLRQRYDYVLGVARGMGGVGRFLDLGCGSGDLTVLMAEEGAACAGVDFSPEMIALAERLAEARRVADRCAFSVGSVLDFEPAGEPFDLAALLGVIEYLSAAETAELLARCRSALRDGGNLIVESRNRLFNLVTFNDYTRHEIETGNLEALMAEALAIVGAESMADCLARLAALEGTAAPLESYPVTGVPVTVRHQYTPAQACRLLRESGLTPLSISPYHYHVAPPRFLDAHPALHAGMARAMQEHVVDCATVLPYASSYLILAARD